VDDLPVFYVDRTLPPPCSVRSATRPGHACVINSILPAKPVFWITRRVPRISLRAPLRSRDPAALLGHLGENPLCSSYPRDAPHLAAPNPPIWSPQHGPQRGGSVHVRGRTSARRCALWTGATQRGRHSKGPFEFEQDGSWAPGCPSTHVDASSRSDRPQIAYIDLHESGRRYRDPRGCGFGARCAGWKAGGVSRSRALLSSPADAITEASTRVGVSRVPRAPRILHRARIVFVVTPETVLRWHREGYRRHWRGPTERGPGRPPIARRQIRGGRS
jgi:hypothetical protein